MSGSLAWISARADDRFLRIAVDRGDGRLLVWMPHEDRVVVSAFGTDARRARCGGDGRYLVAIGGKDDLLVGWGDGTKLEATIPTRHGTVADVATHPSKRWCATTGENGSMRVWDLETRGMLFESSDAAPGVAVALSEACVAVGFRDGRVRTWELATWTELAAVRLFDDEVSAITFRPDGASVIAACGKGGLAEVVVATGARGAIWRAAAPSREVSVDARGRIALTHLGGTSSLVESPGAESKPLDAVTACFVPGSDLLVGIDASGNVRLWQLPESIAEISLEPAPKVVSGPATSAWFLWEETTGRPRLWRSVSSTPVSRTCAACDSHVTIEIPWLESKSWPEEPWAFGLDGRPSYVGGDLGRDVRVLEEEQLRLETCPRCDHVAPRIDVPFPHLDAACVRRESLASVGEYGPTALRYLYVSALYGDADTHQQALWVLRAAWAAEAMGLATHGSNLRRFAATLFEESLAGGVAIQTYRGGTSIAMSELYRVGGDFVRAAEHCRRGLLAVLAEPKAFGESVPISLLAEADRIVAGRRDVLRRQTVKDEWITLSKPRRNEILGAIEAACPTPPPLRQRTLRTFHHPHLSNVASGSLTEERRAFARDFLDADRLIHHLGGTSFGVWEALCARPRLLAPLLLATDHDDAVVRRNAMTALYDRQLSFPPEVLDGRVDAIDALSRRLLDDDDTVCRAGTTLLQIARLAPAFRERIAASAQAALGQRSHDLSAEGMLERLGARPP